MSAFAALRYKDFRYCSGIRFLFTCAYQMQATVLGFYIYQVTHSKTAIAWMGLSEALPAIGFALFGGHIVDRSGKRSMLLLVHVIALSTALVVGGAAWGHTVAPLLLYALLCCNGFARALYEPSIFAVHAGSIPREHFANAGSWGNISWQGATVIGPLLGSLLYVEGGLPATYMAILPLLGCSLVLVLRLGAYPPVQTEQEPLWPSVRAGLRFVFHQKMVCYAMSLDLFSVLFGGVIALLPVYALDILKVGPEGLGMMRVACPWPSLSPRAPSTA
jgi:MFS family permease